MCKCGDQAGGLKRARATTRARFLGPAGILGAQAAAQTRASSQEGPKRAWFRFGPSPAGTGRPASISSASGAHRQGKTRPGKPYNRTDSTGSQAGSAHGRSSSAGCARPMAPLSRAGKKSSRTRVSPGAGARQR